MSDDAPLLELRNLETYYGPIMAIRGVSLKVFEGQIVSILGANGAGKSTVLKTISGALDPQKGQVLFQGREIQGRDPDRVARLGIAHVPEGREVFPFLSVEHNLLMGAYTRRDRQVAADLELVYEFFPALRSRRSQPAGLLSGGQQQMLAIGRALMAKPKLLLLDEPSMGLAPKIVEQILENIRAINQAGVTVLLVEQNAAMALEISHRGYVLETGLVILEGSAEDLAGNDLVRQAYLGG